MKRPTLTAREALRRVMATGWRSDALAEDAAVSMLVEYGDDPLAARKQVRKELDKLKPQGAC